MEQEIAAIRQKVVRSGLFVTAHADEEAAEENISLHEIRESLLNGVIVEDYADHRRGPCCLIYGRTSRGRHLHVVVTKEKEPVRIITVYEPKLPYWKTPTERGGER